MELQPKVYMLEKDISGESTLEQGYAYTVNPEYKDSLIKAGKAVEIAFPTVDALEIAEVKLLEKYRKDRQALQEDERYADAKSFLDYELKQLRKKLDDEMVELRTKYEGELSKLQTEVAEKALAVSYEVDPTVDSFLSVTLTKLGYTDNLLGDLRLLEIKVNAMTEKGKVTALQRFGQIKEFADKYNGQNKKDVDATVKRIFGTLNKADLAREHDLKLAQIQAVRQSGFGAHYNVFKLAEQGKLG